MRTESIRNNENGTTRSKHRENANKRRLRRARCEETDRTDGKNTNRFDGAVEKRTFRFNGPPVGKGDDSLKNVRGDGENHQKSPKTDDAESDAKIKIDRQSIAENADRSTRNAYDECRELGGLLTVCFGHTEELLRIMNKMKNDLDAANGGSKACSSGSSGAAFDSDLERPVVMIRGIKKRLNDLERCVAGVNDKIKNHKNARLREILNLKNKN